jgi:hypothetical protein
MDRQEAAFVAMRIEQRQLLLAVFDVAGVVDVEDDKQRANRSATLRRRSAMESSITPPSEVSRPPSKSAVTFLRPTAGNEYRSVIHGGCGSRKMREWVVQATES